MARPLKIQQPQEPTEIQPSSSSSPIRYNAWLDDIINASKGKWKQILLIGGTRSGKSYQLIIFICLLCLFPEQYLGGENLEVYRSRKRSGLTVFVARQQRSDVKDILLKDFIEVLTAMNLWPENNSENTFLKFNASELNLTFKTTKSVIHFRGSDKTGGKKMGMGVDILWLNEISEINEDFHNQLNQRKKMFALYDCNPKMTSNHWGKRVLLRGEGRVVYVHRSTFLDNGFLTETERQNVLSYDPSNPDNVLNGTANDYMWKVYGLGQFAILEGAVFPEESQEFPNGWANCDSFPQQCSWVWCLDVGFRDEMAFGRVGIYRGNIYIDVLVYESNLAVATPVDAPAKDSLIKRFESLGVRRGDTIVYDAAAASAGDSLLACGYNAVPARKNGAERSIVPQLQMMSRYKIFVTKTSEKNAWQNEALEYKWRNKDGGDDNPVSLTKKDHAIDMSRYGAVFLMKENGDYARGLTGGRSQRTIIVARTTNYRGFI